MPSSQLFPSWPPALSPAELDSLQHAAITYALANALVIKPPHSTPGAFSAAIHAPFSLFPSPFPRDQFEKAVRIQTAYNQLYANIASSPHLIREVIGKTVSKVDPFIGRLYQLWDQLEAEGKNDEHVSLGLFRSDYLLHQPGPDSALEIKQVEFNTVSASFGCLATQVSGLHRYLTGLTTHFSPLQLPENQALNSLSQGLAHAHETYLSAESPSDPVVILMVTQPNERNIFDQTLLEYALDSRPGRIRVARISCHQILQSTHLEPDSKKLYHIAHGVKSEVSVVYYRCMYGPEDFVNQNDWDGRYQLERSRAINCPNLSTQLAGCKKIQQVITDETFLEAHQGLLTGIDKAEWHELQSTWVAIHSMGAEGYRLASSPSTAPNYVLKPQREGGGNNIYGCKIPEFLQSLPEDERAGYILMSLIRTPQGIHNILLRPLGDPSASLAPAEVVSELGVYGVCLFQRDPNSDGALIVRNSGGGHLLRTKNCESDEGGVAVGISCLDSPLLF